MAHVNKTEKLATRLLDLTIEEQIQWVNSRPPKKLNCRSNYFILKYKNKTLVLFKTSYAYDVTIGIIDDENRMIWDSQHDKLVWNNTSQTDTLYALYNEVYKQYCGIDSMSILDEIINELERDDMNGTSQ